MNTNNEDFFFLQTIIPAWFLSNSGPVAIKTLNDALPIALRGKDRSKLRKIQRQANFRDFFLKCKNCQMTGKPRD